MVRTFIQDKKSEKRNTVLLLLALAVVFILISTAAYLVLLVTLSYDVELAEVREVLVDLANIGGIEPSLPSFWGLRPFLYTSFFAFLIMLLTSIGKYFQLGAGGIGIAERMNARKIYPSTRDISEKRAFNVLTELAIAAGNPVPPLYLLENEKGINAFAAGLSQDDEAVVLTQGCVHLLNRDEIQGVLAHELGHLYNKDSHLKLILMALLAPIEDIALFGKRLLKGHENRELADQSATREYCRGAKSSGGGGPIFAGGLLIVIGYLGLISAKIIKAAILRGRERLADSMAVEWTRNPLGMASCLKKIYALQEGGIVENRWAEEYSHLFFASAIFSDDWLAFDTHPPLEERIAKLDPSWDGVVEPISYEELEKKVITYPDQRTANSYVLTANNKLSARFEIKFDSPLAELVAFNSADNSFSALLLQEIPAAAIEIAHEPYGVKALLYSFFLSNKGQLRDLQLEQIMKLSADRIVARKLRRLLQIGQRLSHDTKRLLMLLTLPILRELSFDEYCVYRSVILKLTKLAENDRQRSELEELAKLSCRELDPLFS